MNTYTLLFVPNVKACIFIFFKPPFVSHIRIPFFLFFFNKTPLNRGRAAISLLLLLS